MSRLGPGVEKSINNASALFLAGDCFVVLFCRSSSKVGIVFGGVKGTVGFKIDLGWNEAIVCLSQRSD